MKKAVFLILAAALLSFCKKPGVMCTMEFRMFTVEIVDSADNPVFLDDYYMVRIQDNDTIMTMANNEFQDPLTEGIVIFTSGNFEQTSKSGMQFRFTGYLNGQQVVNELYTFNRDDCHFNYVSGKQKIVIQ